ncbi:MAG: hypothetical protein ACRDTF_13720 [Pseudonocardiaceae bacterium]
MPQDEVDVGPDLDDGAGFPHDLLENDVKQAKALGLNRWPSRRWNISHPSVAIRGHVPCFDLRELQHLQPLIGVSVFSMVSPAQAREIACR